MRSLKVRTIECIKYLNFFSPLERVEGSIQLEVLGNLKIKNKEKGKLLVS